jgi:hypothetical protein
MEPWVRDLIIGGVILLVGGYIRYVLNDLKGDIADNKKATGKNAGDIEANEKGISAAKKELYDHTEKTYYTKETMDAKIIALKYRQGDRSGDPNTTI